ncbi:MAG TPA: PleD family two-component system response regulator [Crinalium sp.]|jgi:diguanylate cyclase (GGDEF)-like protein
MKESDLPGKTPLILIVDDEKFIRLVLRRVMEREGYDVAEATDGEDCLSFCHHPAAMNDDVARIPDIILLDAMMPFMDGFTCCSQLKLLLGDACPPIVIVTTLNDKVSVDRAFDAGATDYITKPIQWPVLLQRVRRLLQTQWAMQEQKRLMAELQATMNHERLLKEQLEIANQKLERLASLDGLTQIANRRCFDECLQYEWQRLAREQLPLALLLCDVDFFKEYNDRYGHLAGDECLKHIAKIMQHSVKRPADLVARFGGEEFAVVLPNTSVQGAIHVVEEIQDQLKEKAIAHRGSPISSVVTLSIGLAGTIPLPQNSPVELIERADQALYQAKLQGKNQYCTYGEF